jgi:hypothetical protein
MKIKPLAEATPAEKARLAQLEADLEAFRRFKESGTRRYIASLHADGTWRPEAGVSEHEMTWALLAGVSGGYAERDRRTAARRAKGAAVARASPALAEKRARRARVRAERYAMALDWQRQHPHGRPHQLAKYLGVSARTLRRILRGK